MNISEVQSKDSSSCFPGTLWTQVIQVIQTGDPNAAWAALSEFCERYRPAVYNFIRLRVCSPEQAEDHTQKFFETRILRPWDQRQGFLYSADRSHGKFRSFLSHVLWQFLKDEWKREGAIKRGGGFRRVPLEGLDLADESSLQGAFQKFGSEFDRVFALELIKKAAQQSKHSKHVLAHFLGEISQQEAARELGLSKNAFKQNYHRFKERLPPDLWDEVRRLVGPDEHEIGAEIEYLMSLFDR